MSPEAPMDANTPPLSEVRERYRRGENITQLFREWEQRDTNSTTAIEVAYDMQAGTYVEGLGRPEFAAFSEKYTAAIAEVISELGPAASILEAGVGEATTLSFVAPKLARPAEAVLGFDISWSRVACGRAFARTQGLEPTLFVGDLFRIPLPTDSVDVVYTSHSIEPNGGREREAIAELVRVARRHVVLLEPSNELGSDETRARMKRLGYVHDLGRHAREMGLEVVEHRLFDHCINPTNQTGLLVIAKDPAAEPRAEVPLASPLSRAPLHQVRGHLFCDHDLRVYPVLDGVPCLRPENGVIASDFGDLDG